MTVEEKFWKSYEQNRAHWHQVFMDALLDAKLPSYLKVPKELLLVAVGKSMDLLVEALRNRDMEAYVSVQRENFRARVKAGISKEDLHVGQKLAAGVLEAMVNVCASKVEPCSSAHHTSHTTSSPK
jgi:hypothetical protein